MQEVQAEQASEPSEPQQEDAKDTKDTTNAKATTVATPPNNPSKFSSFLLWRNNSSRFLTTRTRSVSDFSSSHPLQTTLQSSNSTPDLKIMAAVGQDVPSDTAPQDAQESRESQDTSLKINATDGNLLQTPSDPRTPSSASTISRNDSVLESNHHPDLHDEVSKLNEKLIDAINHQASLDETLQQTRNELETARKLIAKLESDAKETRQRAEENDARLAQEMQAEKELRSKAEQDKKTMEQELETLTSALFIEANTMVSDARRDKEASDKKIEQLRAQLQESEVLLQSHQAQLTDLKTVLEKLSVDENESSARTASNPSSPRILPNDQSKALDANGGNPEAGSNDIAPEQPLNFSHLLRPVLRTDHSAYQEFATLIKQAIAASPPPSRVVSGSYSNLNGSGAGSPTLAQFPTPTVGAFPNISLVPGGAARNLSSPIPIPILRESKVFKKALAEDIEPALRLDIAPGISWMVRRPIVNSMIEGSLVVEPMPPSPVKGRGLVNQCSLCGENRVGELYTRKHRFRISEDKESKRFPLCDLCLGRLRSCCELLSFLRTINGGHLRADSDDEIKSAWEEFVKLRERIFWHRMAGGVVPVNACAKEPSGTSARPSLEAAPADAEAGAESAADPAAAAPTKEEMDNFVTPVATPQADPPESPITIVVQDVEPPIQTPAPPEPSQEAVQA